MFAAAPAAFAASPQQIYRDYADNGRLDHQYSKGDLQRALKYAALQGYSKVGVQGAVQQALGAQAVKTNGGFRSPASISRCLPPVAQFYWQPARACASWAGLGTS